MIITQISSDTIATSCAIIIKAPSPVLALCRRLVAEGCDPAMPMKAYRGEILCLTIKSIGEAATLQVSGHGGGFSRATEGGAAPYSDFLDRPAPAPIRESNKGPVALGSSLAA